jgi:EmrB/QacA subfamily drug resistance transporter
MKPRPLVIASAGAFVAALSTSLVAVSVPVIAKDMAVTPADASWVLSSYLLAISCLLALAGKTADVLGRKRVYLVGFAFFVAGSAACAIAPTLSSLVGARVVQGVGAAMLMAVGPAIVTRSVPPERRARGLGIQLGTTYVGLTLGPSLGGLLASHVRWQAIFVVIAAVGFVAGWLAVRLLPSDGPSSPSVPRASLDLGGAALFAIGLAAVLVALKRTQEDGWTGRPVLLIAAIAFVTFAVFARHEAKHAAPVLPLRLFREPAFAFGVVGATLLYTVTFILSYALTFEPQHGAGLTATRAGAFMTTQPAMMAITAPLSGVLADRWGPRLPSTAGMLAIGSGLVCIACTSNAPGLPLVLSLALVGLGAGLYVAPNTALIMGAAPRDRQAMAGAMAATARNVGMTLGIALAASLGAPLGFRRTLFVAAGLAGLAAGLGLVRPVARSGG